ncbi:MAG: alpha/beta fold hydrolase, partial [Chthoniobacteraceae bacterium]
MRTLLLLALVFASHLALGAAADEPRDIAFKASIDGTEQRYVELLPSGFDAAASHDVVLAFHGHGSDRWQFIRDARGECRGVRDVAAKFGVIVVSPDYRAKTSWMGPKAEVDVVQIIAELKQRHKVGRVFLAGGSMGGTAVLTFTASHPELVAGVCSLNGIANLIEYEKFQDARTESFGGSKTDVPEEYKKRSAELWPEKFTMPVAFTTGGKDELVPPQSVLRLVEKLKQAKRKVLSIHREAGGHSTTYEDTCTAMEFMLREAGCLSLSDQEMLCTGPKQLEQRLASLSVSNPDLLADAVVFSKGINWALRYETALAASDVAAERKALERGTQRADALAANKPTWTTKKGKVLRGFVSAVDGSTQPY